MMMVVGWWCSECLLNGCVHDGVCDMCVMLGEVVWVLVCVVMLVMVYLMLFVMLLVMVCEVV